jgi:PAS domain S-box-containing protein
MADQLENGQVRLQTLMEIMPNGVFVADANGCIVQTNDAVREIFGGDLSQVDNFNDYVNI